MTQKFLPQNIGGEKRYCLLPCPNVGGTCLPSSFKLGPWPNGYLRDRTLQVHFGLIQLLLKLALSFTSKYNQE